MCIRDSLYTLLRPLRTIGREYDAGLTTNFAQQSGRNTADFPVSYTHLNLLSAPGNDAVATSALAGAGCHMVLFSTGRGTPYGGCLLYTSRCV